MTFEAVSDIEASIDTHWWDSHDRGVPRDE